MEGSQASRRHLAHPIIPLSLTLRQASLTHLAPIPLALILRLALLILVLIFLEWAARRS